LTRGVLLVLIGANSTLLLSSVQAQFDAFSSYPALQFLDKNLLLLGRTPLSPGVNVRASLYPGEFRDDRDLERTDIDISDQVVVGDESAVPAPPEERRPQ
jgi:hypothetical protein